MGSHAAPPAWRVATADATGALHVAKQMHYEDAWAVAPARGLRGNETPVVVAVADGHGHARHFRSSRGAEMAVAAAARLGMAIAADIAAATDAEQVADALRQFVGPAVVSTWRDYVYTDLDESPVTDDERAAAGLDAEPTGEDLVYGYGTTLLLTVAAGPWLGCLQLGDGDLFLIAPDGSVDHPVPFDPRLDGLRTTSMCQPDAIDSIRYAVVEVGTESVGAVMLATDGFGNAQRYEAWPDLFGAELAMLAERYGTTWIADQLPDWVRACATADGSGDDVTAALLFAADTTWRPGDFAGRDHSDDSLDVLDQQFGPAHHGAPETRAPWPRSWLRRARA
jgi:hypothetical protein